MLNQLDADVQSIHHFLHGKTPTAWLEHAAMHIPLLLKDHAHCERKAAATAVNFISKYPEKKELVALMAPLAREELLHFEKVLAIMRLRNIPYGALPPCSYATYLHQHVSKKVGNQRLCEELIVGAIIEARSCERFYALIPYIEEKSLAKFYYNLVKAEARHFHAYLQLAKLYSEQDISMRLTHFLTVEYQFITKDDPLFRFHSGVPALQSDSLATSKVKLQAELCASSYNS